MIALVVPTVRGDMIKSFLEQWKAAHFDKIIVVQDGPEKTFDLPKDSRIYHYAWDDIDYELQDKAWIIPRRTDCIRSYGFLKAADHGADIIITLDDDCIPNGGAAAFVDAHVNRLSSPNCGYAWRSTISGSEDPRGIPADGTRSWDTVANVGLWSGVPDLDAVTQLYMERHGYSPQFSQALDTFDPGTYFPMCGMNLAFWTGSMSMMYFPLMGQMHKHGNVYKLPYDRFGDIWCGLFAQRICEHLRLSMKFGNPLVHHTKASNVFDNLSREANGVGSHERLWRIVDGVVLTGTNIPDAYKELSAHIGHITPMLHDRSDVDYWRLLETAMCTWLEAACFS